jgi:hypothetical protein
VLINQVFGEDLIKHLVRQLIRRYKLAQEEVLPVWEGLTPSGKLIEYVEG